MIKRLISSLCILGIAVFVAACASPGKGDTSTAVFYTVTFVQEGQDDVVITVEQGQNIQLPKILATPPIGYSYEWERTDFSTLSEDITVQLKAVPNAYTIYYDIGDDPYAQIENETQVVLFDSDISLLVPTRFGYTFIGWLLKNTNEAFSAEKYEVAGDSYLVAEWEIDIDSDRWFTPDL